MPENKGSILTVQVKYSTGTLVEGCEPLRLMSIFPVRFDSFPGYGSCIELRVFSVILKEQIDLVAVVFLPEQTTDFLFHNMFQL